MAGAVASLNCGRKARRSGSPLVARRHPELLPPCPARGGRPRVPWPRQALHATVAARGRTGVNAPATLMGRGTAPRRLQHHRQPGSDGDHCGSPANALPRLCRLRQSHGAWRSIRTTGCSAPAPCSKRSRRAERFNSSQFSLRISRAPRSGPGALHFSSCSKPCTVIEAVPSPRHQPPGLLLPHS